MNNAKSVLEALRNELQNLEKRLQQIEKQDQFSRIEADFLLDQIRELYASGLDLQQAVNDQSSSTKTHDQPEKGHQEEAASPEQDIDDKLAKNTAVDNKAKKETRSFISSNPEENSQNNDAEEGKQEEPKAFKPSANPSSDWKTTTPSPDQTSSNTDDPKEEQGNDIPEEANKKQDENLEQQPLSATDPEPEKAKPSDEKPGNTAQKGDSGAKETSDQSEGHSTQDRHQNKRGQALHEKFEGKQISLHEQLVANNSGKSLLDHFKNAPIDDLRSAIGLNERAKFIRELFGGQRQAYFDTIDALNNMDTYNEALQYLEHTIKPAHEWDNHQKAVEDFMELVYRRFVSSDA